MEADFVSIIRQTWQERYNSYMRYSKEELASMLAENAKIVSPENCAELATEKDICTETAYVSSFYF